MDAAGLVRDADRAAAARNFAQAASLLERAAALSPEDPALWIRIAAVRRGAGKAAAALDAVHKALAISPRDFTGLLMRASLLQRMGLPQAGEAWGHAVAQKPDGDIPPPLQAALAEAEQRYAAWQAEKEADLRGRMASAEKEATDEERQRIARFRSNSVRRTRAYHSEPTDFQFPELTEREFHPRRLFPWLEELEAATEAITAELRQVMAAERAELVPYVQFEDHIPMDQWRPLNRNPDWTAIHLLQHGKKVEANARHCPQTMAILDKLPQPDIPGASPNAMFSLLAPKTEIPPHVGIGNTRLVCHLPLIVPEGCWFRVGAETRHWKVGEAFVFDDTMEHEAANPSDELRVVFICDIWHPDLSPTEREAVAALISAKGAAGDGL
ncbi:MAG TPA: aspartyl/asparaginyl beta-hydroxylase domain-containing protein [Sphingomicrobium sp.]|nr:aspartyl/asparaginyl beta-hydroxylase domain-containing protein [Sphingomicrobium sp.]